MKSFFIYTIVGVGLVMTVQAQTLQPIDTVSYGFTDEVYGRVADFDSNGKMDYVFFRKDSLTAHGMSAYMLTWDSLLVDTLHIPGLIDTRFYLAEMNHDSRLDILVSSLTDGSYLSILYYQQDSLSFQPEVLDTVRIAKAAFSDLNNDGKKEIIYSAGDDTLRIKQRKDSVWITYTDSITQTGIDDWLVYDANADGWQDLLISFTQAGKAGARFYQNDSGTFVDRDSAVNLWSSDHVQAVDYNNDGKSDLLNAGNEMNQEFTIGLINEDTAFTVVTMPVLEDFEIFAADFNSDGLMDIHLTGKYADSTSIVQLYISDAEGGFTLAEELSSQGKLMSSIGDLDTDGDLDRVVQRWDSIEHQIQRFRNVTAIQNKGPLLVEEHFSFATPGGLILSWSDATDDHTPGPAITYDVAIGTDPFKPDVLAPNFNLHDTRRFLPVAGNAHSRNELRINNMSPGRYDYGIQSVDNALHYLRVGEYGEGGPGQPHCNGRLMACGELTVCESTKFETHYVCPGDSLTLSLGYPTAWYSANEGFLGVYDSLLLQPMNADTLYTSANDCSEATDFIIAVMHKMDLLASSDTTVCEGELLELAVSGADSVQWVSSGGFSSVTSQLSRFVLSDEMVYVNAYFKGCLVTDSILVKSSKPRIGELESVYKIVKGESVRFNLTPGYSYEWSPQSWLSNASISNPEASPRQSLRYQVIAYDTLGCTATDSVLVTVVDQGWVPDLFTPNNDGSNDQLKIFGLQNVRDFHFAVYSRSGERVFETDNISEISSIGWDGTENGKPLPNGGYSWRVSGVLDDHSPVLLNGEESGVVYIIR